MKSVFKTFSSLLFAGVVLMLTGCRTETLETDIAFKATNFNVEVRNEPIVAQVGTKTSITTNELSITINVNGESYATAMTVHSNELPVVAGNEIEIEFLPTCPEETEAFFTLPDGMTKKVSAASPIFKWTVPENFNSRMEIKGESNYETKDVKYKASNTISLIPIK